MSENRLRREWDAFDAYLFDIDGTLIHCADAVHYFAFCDALSAIAGRPLNLDGVTAHGNTDTGILRDAFARAGVPENEWRTRLPEICARMCAFVQSRRSDLCVQTLPMVKDVLRHLHAKGAKIGVATGNLGGIGSLKLQAAGLLELFDFAGWSDGMERRTDVFARAVTVAQQHAGAGADILIIGDTPADVRAAHDHDLPVVAVATGIYSFEQLQGEAPEMCIQSFEELLIAA